MFISRFRNFGRDAYAWAFYDWANSSFATVVLAGFFPIFFKEYWSFDKPVTESTFFLGAANSSASLIILILAPILGAIADRGRAKKRFLSFFVSLGVIGTGLLYFVVKGDWAWACLFYMAATMGFMGANIFYDAFIVTVSERKNLDIVSALGFSLGYLGGGLLFLICVLMALYPGFFGFSDTSSAIKFSFLLVAIWWAVFSLPMFRCVKEPDRSGAGLKHAVKEGLIQLEATFHHIKKYKKVGLFLLAYWLYIDGVDTVVRMAVDYGLSIGFKADGLMVALLITQFVGFPAALVFGRIGEKIGARNGILIGISVYFVITLWGYFMDSAWEFYAIAVVVGLVQGGVQLLSRSYFARLIPKDQAGEFFGFYNMLGKFAVIIGPFMMGSVSKLSGNPRFGILSLLVLFSAGGAMLLYADKLKATSKKWAGHKR